MTVRIDNLPLGALFRFDGDPTVYATGKADGMYRNVYTPAGEWVGPVARWTPVEPAKSVS